MMAYPAQYARTRSSILRAIASVIVGIRWRIYSPQVTLAFPAEIAWRAARLPPLPKDFSIIVPASDSDFAMWIELLNEEPTFGSWSLERLRKEILVNLVAPTAATLILHQGRGVGCICAIDGSRRGKRIAYGMYLYVTPKYRARASISYVLTMMALDHGVAVGYRNLWANTYPDRLSALAVFLSIGCRPVHRTLSSLLQWRSIMSRLGPVVEKMKRRNNRRARDEIGRPIEQ